MNRNLRYETVYTEPSTVLGQLPITKSVPVSQGIISLIRFDAVKTMMEMLRSYSPAEILDFFGRDVPSEAVNYNAALNPRRQVALNVFSIGIGPFANSASSSNGDASRSGTQLIKYQTPQSVSSQDVSGSRLYVGNLPYATTEAELMAKFKDYQVESVTIPINPRTSRPVGYGFVTMSNASEAERAISQLNDMTISDRKVSVQLARSLPKAAEDIEHVEEAGQDCLKSPEAGNDGRDGISADSQNVKPSTMQPQGDSMSMPQSSMRTGFEAPVYTSWTLPQLSKFPPGRDQPGLINTPGAEGQTAPKVKKRKNATDENPQMPKRKRLPPVPRCDECKKKKKRCIHNAPPGTFAASPSSDPQVSGKQVGENDNGKSNATQSYDHGTTKLSAQGIFGSFSDVGMNDVAATQFQQSVGPGGGGEKSDKSNFLQGMEAVAAEVARVQEPEASETVSSTMNG